MPSWPARTSARAGACEDSPPLLRGPGRGVGLGGLGHRVNLLRDEAENSRAARDEGARPRSGLRDTEPTSGGSWCAGAAQGEVAPDGGGRPRPASPPSAARCGPRCVSSVTPPRTEFMPTDAASGLGCHPSSGTTRPPTRVDLEDGGHETGTGEPRDAGSGLRVGRSARTVGPAPETTAGMPAARSFATRAAVRGRPVAGRAGAAGPRWPRAAGRVRG